MKISPDELDALTEVVNIGIGRAAASLSELAGVRVILQVPRVVVFQIDSPPPSLKLLKENTLALVRQRFQGEFSGQGMLIFPKESALSLANLLSGQPFSAADGIDDDSEGVLMEVGNILLNAVLGSMGKLFLGPLTFEVPFFELASLENIFRQFRDSDEDEKETHVLQAEATFEVSTQNIQGQILIFWRIESLEQLLKALPSVWQKGMAS